MRYFLPFLVTVIGFLLYFTFSYADSSPTIYLNGHNVVFFDEDVTANSVDKNFSALTLKRLGTDAASPVYLVLTSPGGSIDSGIEFINVVSHVPNVKLFCHYCASMAAGIFEASNLPRLVAKNSRIMMHEATITLTAAEINNTELISFKNVSDRLNSVFYTLMGWTKKDYEKKIKNSELWYTGNEIVNHNLADQLVNVECTPYIRQMAPHTCSGN